MFTQLGRRQDDGLFMFYIFLFAGLATLALLVRRHQPLTGGTFSSGYWWACPTFFLPGFFGRSYPAAGLPGLPSYSVGVILVISVASFFLFQERLTAARWGRPG